MKWGSVLSGVLVSILVGLFVSNVGIIVLEVLVYVIVNKFFLFFVVLLFFFGVDM